MKTPPENQLLVVDESSPSRKALAEILKAGNFSVTCVASGEEALLHLSGSPFNIVITDITLPGMSGLNLLKLIKDLNPDLEVILVTSNASSFNVIKALRLGAYDFVIKPIDDPAILVNIVERALEKQALTIENRRLIYDLQEKNGELNDALRMMRTANQLCAVVSATLDVGEILAKLVDGVVEELRATKGYLLLLDREGTTFSMKISVGIDRELAKNFTLQRDQGLSGLVAANNKPLRIGDDTPPPLTRRIHEEDPNREFFAAPGILSVPLRVKDKVAGVITVSGQANGRPFSDAEAEFLLTVANHAAIALDTAGAFYKLKKRRN